ncbi:MAG: tetratricopeptide repeat protein [Cyclobacteriaceae bacterium]
MRYFFLLSLFCLALSGESQSKADSLLQVWNDGQLADTIRLNAIQDYLDIATNEEPSQDLISLADSAYQLANSTNSSTNIIRAIIGRGRVQHGLTNYDLAVDYFNEGLAISEKIAWQEGVGESLLKTGIAKYKLGQYSEATDLFTNLHDLFTRMDDSISTAKVLQELGKIHLDQGRHEDAMQNFLNALSINESIGNTRSVVGNYIGLGILYVQLEDYPPALDYYQRALTISEELGMDKATGAILNNMAIIYDNTEQNDLALEYYNRSLILAQKVGDKSKIAMRYTNLGALHQSNGDLEKAREFHLKALEINEEIGRKKGATINLTNLGILCVIEADDATSRNDKTLARSKFNKALNYGKQAEKILEETKVAQQMINNYHLLFMANKGLGNSEEAITYLEKYAAKKDSTFSAKYNNDIIRLDLQHSNLKQAEIDSILRAEEQYKLNVQLKQERTENLILYFGILFLMIFGAGMYYFYRLLLARKNTIELTLDKLEKTQDQLLQSRKMAALGVLATGIAHEINNPLNFINGSSELIFRKIEEKYPKDVDDMGPYLHSIKEGVDRISKIIKSLNAFGKSNPETDALCDIQDIIKDCLVILNQELEGRIEITETYNARGIVRGNPSGLHQVFLNVLMNACQSITEEGKISILLEQEEDELKITIRDNGEGIAAENLPKVTDPFFSTKTDINGIGLGMFIAYSILDEHNGTIKFESEIGIGTTVSMTLPVEKGL